MTSIGLKRLKQIIREELERHAILNEGEQEKSAIDHAKAATQCLDAIEKYKQLATSKALGEMQSEIDKLEQNLTRIIASPLNYADAVPDALGPDSEGDLKIAPSDGSKKKSIKPNVVKKE